MANCPGPTAAAAVGLTVRAATPQAPRTALGLPAPVAERFFDDQLFHRVMPEFIVQFGANTFQTGNRQYLFFYFHITYIHVW